MKPKTSNKQYFGKYRATVQNNVDPEQKGRLMLNIPDVLGSIPSTWAEPCVPLAGPTGLAMGVYFVPPISAGVWVEFEHGDPDLPVWVGCRWGQSSDLPLAATGGNPANPNLVMQSYMQHSIVISDLPSSTPPPSMPPVPSTGGIILRSSSGASVVVNDAGVFLSNGQGATIQLLGSSVMINQTALVVT